MSSLTSPHRQPVFDISRQILVSGAEQIVSYPGTSQYDPRGAGTAACGLASLNFARVLFAREAEIKGDHARLLQTILAKDTVEEITSICAAWSSNSHLEVEQIAAIPVFDKSLKLQSTKYGLPGLNQFRTLLSDLVNIPISAAVIITRPPEILACLNLRLSKSTNVFIIFDSHPRQNLYPDGAGLVFNTSLEATARRLIEILPAIDLPHGELQWQAQLLANYSGHVFVPHPSTSTPAHLTQIVLESSLEILALRASVADLTSQNVSLTNENKRLEGELETLAHKRERERRDRALRAERSRRESQRSSALSSTAPTAGPSRRATAIEARTDLHWASDHDPTHSDKAAFIRSKIPSKPLDGSHGDADFQQALLQQQEFDEENRRLREQLERLRQTADGAPISSKAAVESLDDNDANDDFRQALLQQQKFDEESRRLRAQLELLRRTAVQRTFECGICFDEHPEDYIAPIEGCGHTFCRECMRDYVGSMLSQHRFPILCPTCSADRGIEHPGAVEQNILQVLNFTEEQHRTWTELSLVEFSVLMHCRQCCRSAWVDRNDMNEVKILACPLRDCNYVWCKACQQAIEIGGPPHSCDGSSELDHLMRQRGWKYCPTCKTPIQKESGCNHMTCGSPACNTHFCYVCGEKIIQSAHGNEVRNAVSTHYQRCNLFGEVPDVGVPP